MNISDYSNSEWITCFQENSEKILESKAQELGELLSTVIVQIDIDN